MGLPQPLAPDVWEGDLVVGRARVYLVGNPFAEAGNLAAGPDPHLQVTCLRPWSLLQHPCLAHAVAGTVLLMQLQGLVTGAHFVTLHASRVCNGQNASQKDMLAGACA